jgi:hypothetical protein
MEVVLVTWSIQADAVDQFKRETPDLDVSTPGLIGEELYRLEGESADGSVRFLRVGRWANREQFYDALKDAGVKPFTSPPPKPYETRRRRREWLVWTREDTATDEADAG